MATEKQIAANRRNALLSTGPKTGDGKKASSMNAIRHGLTGQINVMTPEEQEAHDIFCEDIESSLAPENSIERQFAHSVADDHWRLNRARSIENNIFTLACSFEDSGDETENPEVEKALGAARVFIADPKRFQLLTIYEGRIHRGMQKNLKLLTELQATRRALEAQHKAQRDHALEEARLLCQLAATEGESCDPSTDYPDPNGFVFSNDEIAQSIRRISRLEAARHAESAGGKQVARHAA
jgi:hypothetical protein